MSKFFFGFNSNEITLSDDLSTIETPNIESIKKEKEKINRHENPYITGIINNINGRNIYVNITPQIIGLIRNNTRKTTNKTGDEIQVKIQNITK